MKIENNIIKNRVPLGEIKTAEVFLFSDEYWLKTAKCVEHKGEMLWTCINMKEGFESKLNSLMYVIPVDARLIVE